MRISYMKHEAFILLSTECKRLLMHYLNF